MSFDYKLPYSNKKISYFLFFIGVVFLLAGYGYEKIILKSKIFFFTWLFSSWFFMSISLGALFFILINYITRSKWVIVTRRIAEAFMKNIHISTLLILPVLIGMDVLYNHWIHPHGHHAAFILKKTGYLNISFFLIRIFIYLLLWNIVARYFFKKSIEQDEQGGYEGLIKLQKNSSWVIFLMAFTLTFASFDFLMSLEPHWYSTIFGVYVFAGGFVAFIACFGITLSILRMFNFLKKEVNIEHYHDIGKLLFGFNVFWSYIAYSQYFIIWYANIPEETSWYLDRHQGNWLNLSIFLAIGHFAVPLILFISRNFKRNLKFSFFIYVWLLFMHIVDVYWLVMPSAFKYIKQIDFSLDFSQFFVFFGMLIIYIGGIIFNLAGKNLIPIKDPRLPDSLKFKNH